MTMFAVFADKSLCDTSDIISDSSGVGTANSDSITLPGTSVVCVENYSSGQPGHLRLCQGDILEGLCNNNTLNSKVRHKYISKH